MLVAIVNVGNVVISSREMNERENFPCTETENFLQLIFTFLILYVEVSAGTMQLTLSMAIMQVTTSVAFIQV